MTHPDIGIGHQLVALTPLCQYHLFARKRPVGGGQVTDRGTGSTLVALFQGISARSLDLANEIQIGFY
jgi:hypothetical protein